MRARQWCPELGTFLTIDEYAFHEVRTTLWGWPSQNPIRYADPDGRGAFGAWIGAAVGAYAGGTVGAQAGAAAFGIAAIETGPGELVAVPTGAIVGAVLGASLGAGVGAKAGSDIEDGISAALAGALEAAKGRDREGEDTRGLTPEQIEEKFKGKRLPKKSAT